MSLTWTENNSDKKHFLPEVLCPWLAFHPSTRVWSSHADTAWPGCQTQFLHGPVNKMTSLLHLLPSKLLQAPTQSARESAIWFLKKPTSSQPCNSMNHVISMLLCPSAYSMQNTSVAVSYSFTPEHFLLPHCKAIKFSPIWHPSPSVLPCLPNCFKGSSLETVP